MKYHNITKNDMLNGEGLRVVLWVSGCEHHCPECQNSCTWNPSEGLSFGNEEIMEICHELEKDYISGITFSGGDPLHPANREEVNKVIDIIHKKFPMKTIWLYSGYTWETMMSNECLKPIVAKCDVVVDGPYQKELRNINIPWRGSSNQRVISVKESLNQTDNLIILYSN